MDVTVGIETATDFLKHLAIIKSEEEEAAEEPLPVNNGGYDRTLFFLTKFKPPNHTSFLVVIGNVKWRLLFFPAASSVHKMKWNWNNVDSLSETKTEHLPPWCCNLLQESSIHSYGWPIKNLNWMNHLVWNKIYLSTKTRLVRGKTSFLGQRNGEIQSALFSVLIFSREKKSQVFLLLEWRRVK